MEKIKVYDKETFIEKARTIHGDKFNYDLFEYTGSKKHSIIVCNECGNEIRMTPSNHLIGHGCKNCNEIKRIEVDLMDKLKELYPNWTFDLSDYVNRESLIGYVCDKGHHGIALVKNIMRYNVCPICHEEKLHKNRIEKLLNNNLEFIEYVDKDKKLQEHYLIKCRCAICGHIIIDKYRNLTYDYYNCEKCYFINAGKKTEKNKDVEILEIRGNKLLLKCKNDHIYEQFKSGFTSGRGCLQCMKDATYYTLDEVKEVIKEVHGDVYTYDFSNFKNTRTKIKITCNKGHVFEQTISNHMLGKGCPICKESKGEKSVTLYLKNNKIKYQKQKTYPDCKNINVLPFDFYLPDYNILIEYDGIQHFRAMSFYGGELEFNKTRMRDQIKTEYCLNNNIQLIRISYLENIKEVLDKNIKHPENDHFPKLGK